MMKAGFLATYYGKDEHAIMPAFIKDKKIIRVEPNVFESKYGTKAYTIKEVTIPKTITNISNEAFSGCVNLKTIYIESGSTLEIPTSSPWGAPNATVVEID